MAAAGDSTRNNCIQELQENTGTSGAAGQNRVDCGLQAVVVESKEDSINGTCKDEDCSAPNDDNVSERDDCGLQAVVVESKEDSIDGTCKDEDCSAPNDDNVSERDDCGLQAVVVESKEDSIDGTCKDEDCSAPNDDNVSERDDCGLQAVVVESKEDSIDGTCKDEDCSAPNDDNVSERDDCGLQAVVLESKEDSIDGTCKDEDCSAPNDDNVSERDDCGLQAVVLESKEDSIDGTCKDEDCSAPNDDNVSERDDCGLQAVVVESKEDSIDGTCKDEDCSAPNDDNVSERDDCGLQAVVVESKEDSIDGTCKDEDCSAPNDDNVSERDDCGLQAVVVESKEDSIDGTCEHEVCPAHNDDNMSERDDCGLQAVVVEFKEDSIDGKTSLETPTVSPSGLTTKINIPSDTTIEIEEWNNNNERHHIKKIANGILSSIAFRILEILLIFIDLALMGTDVVITMTKLSIALEYRAVSFVIALFFLLDVVLQIYVKGKKHYFSHLLNILDIVTIGIILLIDITYIFFYVQFFNYIQRMAVFFRLLRLITFVRIFHLANQTRYLENLIRRLVSGNKRRYAKDGFDLDLTYITERLIAMSFPSSGKHAVYRNPMEEVVHFLDTRHPEHYFVYNLCSERSYDPRFFHHRMHRILIDDHNVPTLQEMISFSKEVIAWLSKDPQNTIAIHCKGGKGRTGTMICVCLLAMDTFSTAKESLTYFGERRTDKRFCDKFQGVETPSQSRYVGYFETIKTMWNWELPVKKTLTITKIVLYSIKGVGEGNGKDLTIDIIMQHKTVFTCTGQTCEVSHDIETNRAIFIVPNCPALCDDIKLKFTSKNLPNHYENCAFFFWCNVSLIEKNRLYLTRNELDNPHKPKTWSIYDENFAVELYFEEVFV